MLHFLVKKRRLFLRFSLLPYCLRVSRLDASGMLGMLGVLAAQSVRGMLGMPGMPMLGLHLSFEEPVSRCSLGLILFPRILFFV